MPTWRTKSSSLAPTKTQSDSALKHRRQEGDGNFNFFNTRSLLFGQRRRLTRQRKIRHLSDRDLGLSDRDRARSLPVSPNAEVRSPDCLEHWSLSAVPHPLPLPGLCRKDGFSGSDRPSPNSLRDGTRGCDGTGDVPSSSTCMSYFGGQAIRKNTDHAATNSAKPSRICSNGLSRDLNAESSNCNSRICSNGLSRDLNAESSNCNLRLDILSKSAPSSPALSPRRSTGDFFSSSNVAPQNSKNPSSVRAAFSLDSSPLPLPELCRRDGFLGYDHPPNSPREGARGSDGTVDILPSSSTFMSYYGGQAIRKNSDHAATNSAKSSSSCSNRLSRDLNTKSSNHNLRLDMLSRSAPSSPALSPRRLSTGFFSSSYVAPQKSKNPSPVRAAFSLDSSPQHSPAARNPGGNPPSPRGMTFQLHNRFLPESYAAWPESRNVHPLPLPPGALGSPQSANIHHTIEKPSVSSMKNQWQKGKLIGRGTFGSVYVATNRETGALCALKEVDIIPDDPKSAECIKQLEQEIEVLSQLKHPNIVQYYGSETVGDHFCIYLEYIYPGSINKYIHQFCGAMTESVLRNFTRHVLNGLAYLHSTNTIHRDIKGANLLVDAAGIVKLADFGMAKHLTGQAYDLSFRGSPYWMAPEVMQATMLRDANPDRAFAVDIWSLGCTIIEMMNGKPPWSELEAHAAMFKVLNKTPPIPDSLSWEGKDFLRSCFRRNPKERPSARMLLDHPFLRNPRDYTVSVCTQAFTEIKLVDKAHNTGDWAKQKTDSKPISPSITISNKNSPSTGETSWQCYAENSNSAVACRHSSPVVNTVPVLPLQRSSHGSHNLIPSANVPNNMEHQTMSYHPNTLLRTHGREVPHV